MTPIIKVLNAWNVEGVNPRHHREMKWRLRNDWPRLYAALEELAADERLQAIERAEFVAKSNRRGAPSFPNHESVVDRFNYPG